MEDKKQPQRVRRTKAEIDLSESIENMNPLKTLYALSLMYTDELALINAQLKKCDSESKEWGSLRKEKFQILTEIQTITSNILKLQEKSKEEEKEKTSSLSSLIDSLPKV